MTGLKGIGGKAVLPFLETPGTKVKIVMTMQIGDSFMQVWRLTGIATFRLSSRNECHFHHPHGQLLKIKTSTTIFMMPCTTVSCCAPEKG